MSALWGVPLPHSGHKMEGNIVWPKQVFSAIGCRGTSWFEIWAGVMDGVFHIALD